MNVDEAIAQLHAMGSFPTQEEWAHLMWLKTEERLKLDSVSSLAAVYTQDLLALKKEMEFIQHLQQANDALRRARSVKMAAAASDFAASSSRDEPPIAAMRPQSSSDPWPQNSFHTGATSSAGVSSSSPHESAAHGQQLGNEQEEFLPPGTRSLLVRNIPTRVTQDDLMRMWPADGTYDLLYMPWSPKQRRFCGDAFVSFGRAEDALRFWRQWHGETLESHGRTKVLKIVPSYQQGFEECLLGLKREFNETVTANHLPGIFELGTGRRLDFRAVFAQVMARHFAR